eukprot:TRINITY_DN16236_c0_g2_i1.p1 TRINITY_DN16236_c0_g2~~TRINITY_DN16236_c0_g2_i1.p1  ORF type:complete len:432 (-),score=80.00 TRINITY_DN16236_c0_g2_i1:39-1334(-)
MSSAGDNSSKSESASSQEGSDESLGFADELEAELQAESEDEFSPTSEPGAFQEADVQTSVEELPEPPPLTGIKLPSEIELNPADFVTPRNTRPVTPHPGFIWGMCIACGHAEGTTPDPGCSGTQKEFDLDEDESGSQPDEPAGAQQYQVLPDLGGIRMHSSEVNRYRKRKMGQLEKDGKLTLVLDLDHTVLNSSQFHSITQEQHEMLVGLLNGEHKDCPKGPHSCAALLHHNPVIGMWTKLRPYIREFLQNMNELYQLYIYTMGNRGYANAMARLLDDDQSLFGNRIISRDDLKGKTKNLQNVLSDERCLLILDDSVSVWPDHDRNLLVAPRYHFFPQSCKDFGALSPSLLISHRDEDESCGWLPAVEQPLRRVHRAFFDAAEGDKPDVRDLLAQERKQVLAGVRVLFSGCLLYTSPSPRDRTRSRMPSSA